MSQVPREHPGRVKRQKDDGRREENVSDKSQFGEKDMLSLYAILRWENCSWDSKLRCMNAICLFISLNGRMEDMVGKLMFAARNLFTQTGTDRWKPAVSEKWMFHTYIRAPFKLPHCYHTRLLLVAHATPVPNPPRPGHPTVNYGTAWISNWANPPEMG